MSSDLQSLAALAVVVLVLVAFVARGIAKRRHPGCGGDCGCEAVAVKRKLKR